ncbi:hypothetical protein [Botrimarina sp.]|uniref:hypothetical protein n=1 Tax=Botrimarina sp. TaxID=2795802 RepID=UPI0032EF319F
MSCSRWAAFSIGLAASLGGLSGCGSSPELGRVTGVLTIDGQPYPGGKLLFTPVARSESVDAGRAAFGIPDTEGRFELSTFAQGDGALVGEHTVQFLRGADDRATRPDLADLPFRRVTLPSGRVRVEPGENQLDIGFSIDDLKRYGNRL